MISLPAITPGNRLAALCLGYLLFCLCYLGSHALAYTRANYLPLTQLDALIPAWPASLWLYLSQFLLLPLAFMLERDSLRLSRAYYAMLAATLISCTIFVAWPTTVGQEMRAISGWTQQAWHWFYQLDVAGNCFPSLHVSLASLAAWLLAGRGGIWRLLAPGWAALIMLSVLTTRQHRLVDVLGGLCVAALCLRLADTKPRLAC